MRVGRSESGSELESRAILRLSRMSTFGYADPSSLGSTVKKKRRGSN